MAATPQKLTGSLVGTRGWDVSSAGKSSTSSFRVNAGRARCRHPQFQHLPQPQLRSLGRWSSTTAKQKRADPGHSPSPPTATSNHLDIPSRGLVAPPAASREAGRGKASLRSPTPILLYDHACMLLFDLSSRHRSHSGTGAPILANSVICT